MMRAGKGGEIAELAGAEGEMRVARVLAGEQIGQRPRSRAPPRGLPCASRRRTAPSIRTAIRPRSRRPSWQRSAPPRTRCGARCGHAWHPGTRGRGSTGQLNVSAWPDPGGIVQFRSRNIGLARATSKWPRAFTDRFVDSQKRFGLIPPWGFAIPPRGDMPKYRVPLSARGAHAHVQIHLIRHPIDRLAARRHASPEQSVLRGRNLWGATRRKS